MSSILIALDVDRIAQAEALVVPLAPARLRLQGR